jgi:hypothetical protein
MSERVIVIDLDKLFAGVGKMVREIWPVALIVGGYALVGMIEVAQ